MQFVNRSVVYVCVMSSVAIFARMPYLETIVSRTVEGLRPYIIPMLIVSKRGYIVDFLSESQGSLLLLRLRVVTRKRSRTTELVP